MSRTCRMGWGVFVAVVLVGFVMCAAVGQEVVELPEWPERLAGRALPSGDLCLHVIKAVRVLDGSSNAEERIYALRVLGRAQSNSFTAQDYLLRRELDYEAADERGKAMENLGKILYDDISRLLPIVLRIERQRRKRATPPISWAEI